MNALIEETHARAFSVAASYPAHIQQAMKDWLQSKVLSAAPLPTAETALQQWRDARAAMLRS